MKDKIAIKKTAVKAVAFKEMRSQLPKGKE